MDHASYGDDYIRDILRPCRTIAMVGASPHWNRPSYFAMKYLQEKGYRVIPVNPRAKGEAIVGQPVMGPREERRAPIYMGCPPRPAGAPPPIAEAAVRIGAKVLWMQLGVRNDEAARQAEAAGLKVVMNRCPKIEYGRLSGEIAWMGVNTGVISSRKAKKV